MSNSQLLFVYGTLLEGYRNHRVIEGSKFEGVAITDEKFTMFDNGYYPALTEEPTYVVLGEVYEIDDKTFLSTDRLEGYHRKNPVLGHYDRKQITVTMVGTAEKKTAWIYFITDEKIVKGWKRCNVGDFTINHQKVVDEVC